MLRELRKKTLEVEEISKKKNNRELEEFLGAKSRKYYIERNYEKIKFYKYLFFLRERGMNINSFFDIKIAEKKQ